ncbi:siphovirus Gp157 family protein [Parvibaculum sp.]|uniref:siphovirus Gp157 family protein n=1 Tax=Parvibaculum sp. TaxID=2024848 RepID=UPI0039199F83
MPEFDTHAQHHSSHAAGSGSQTAPLPHLPPHLAAAFHAHSYLRERLAAEFPDLDDETLADTLEGETDLNEALAGILRSREEDLALISGLKSRLDALKARLERFQERAERKRRLVTDVMVRAEIKKIVAADFTVSLRTSPPSVVIEDETLIPAMYWKPQPPKLDRVSLGETLKSGGTVEGAALGKPKPSITIRIA